MTTDDAKAYLAKREIPQLFESLMTGLMYYRPEDHIIYLQECLQKVQEQGVESVRWNLFIDQRRKTPLPPISGGNGRSQTPLGMNRQSSFVTDPRPVESKSIDDVKSKPLPPISPDSAGRFQVPQCPIVLVMGGPGSGKATQCERLVQRYSGWIHLSMGDLLRKETFQKGSADEKWGMVGTLIKRGEMAPEDMTVDLLKRTLQQNLGAAGIIIEGYPRTMTQVEELDTVIGRVDLAFVLDCEEQYLQQRLLVRGKETERVDDNMKAVANRISFFKDQTLPVIKHFDDAGKVVIVDGDRDTEEIFYDLSLLFDNTFYPDHDRGTTGAAPVGLPRPPSGPKPRSPRPGSTKYSRPSSRTGSRTGSRPGSRTGGRPSSGFAKVPCTIDVAVEDTGRKEGVLSGPLVCIMGGPGTQRLDLAKQLHEKFANSILISAGELLKANMASAISDGSMAPCENTMDLILNSLKGKTTTSGIILEGYPRNKKQVELLNENIGGLTAVVLLDTEESYMQQKLSGLGVTNDLAAKKISYFKYNTLPIIGHYDDTGFLVQLNGEESDKDKLLKETIAGITAKLHRNDETAVQTPSSETEASSDGVTDVAATSAEEAAPESAPEPAPETSPETRPETQPTPKVECIVVTVKDTGRKEGQPKCPILAVLGAPGSGLESCCQKLAEGNTGFVVAKSLQDISQCTEAKGIILQGFPSNKAEIEQFNENVGGLDRVVVLDTAESVSRERAASRLGEIDTYKEETLPALAHYDDEQKLEYVLASGDEASVLASLQVGVNFVLSYQDDAEEPAGPTGVARLFPSVPLLSLEAADGGRKEGQPSIPIFTIVGYPVQAVCGKIAEKVGMVHVKSDNVDGVKTAMSAAPDAKGFILETYPHTKAQVEEFNSSIGGLTGLVMLDSSEAYLQSKGIPESMLEKVVTEFFPVIAHYDDLGLVECVNSEQSEDDLTTAACQAIEKVLKEVEGAST